MNNVLMRSVLVTGTYQPLTTTPTVASVTISALPTNANNVFFLGDDGSNVPWLPGEWHDFVRIDLSKVKVKGTSGDAINIVGGTW